MRGWNDLQEGQTLWTNVHSPYLGFERLSNGLLVEIELFCEHLVHLIMVGTGWVITTGVKEHVSILLYLHVS